MFVKRKIPVGSYVMLMGPIERTVDRRHHAGGYRRVLPPMACQADPSPPVLGVLRVYYLLKGD